MNDKRANNDDNKRKEDKRQGVETEDVPLYRSYGVTKRVNPVIRVIRDSFAKILAILVLGVELAIIFFVTFMVARYAGGVLPATILFVILVSLVMLNATKLLRRRLKFIRRLKKTCKQDGYHLEFKRGLLKGFSWAEDDAIDFKVKAGKWTYYVKLATSGRFLSSFAFLSKEEMKYTRIARRNRFTTIFDIKDRSTTMPINFPRDIDESDKYSVKAILINPAVMNIEKKEHDGTISTTGSGERLFGYTIYTGTGFIETIKRNAEEQK